MENGIWLTGSPLGPGDPGGPVSPSRPRAPAGPASPSCPGWPGWPVSPVDPLLPFSPGFMYISHQLSLAWHQRFPLRLRPSPTPSPLGLTDYQSIFHLIKAYQSIFHQVGSVTSPLIPGTPGGPWKHAGVITFPLRVYAAAHTWRKADAEISYLVSFDSDVSRLTLVPLCGDTWVTFFQVGWDILNNSTAFTWLPFGPTGPIGPWKQYKAPWVNNFPQ